MINSIFYCIQPFLLSDELFEKMLISKASMPDVYEKPTWVKHIDGIYSTFDKLYLVEEIEFKIFKLKDELKEHDDFTAISSRILTADASLLYDDTLKMFSLVFTVTLLYDEKFLYEDDEFYNKIRKMLVLGEEHLYTETIHSVQQSALVAAKDFTEKLFQWDSDKYQISILPDTGNITNLTLINNLEDSAKESVIKQLIRINSISERVKGGYNLVKLKSNKYDYFSFNGRYHTIIINSEDDEYRYISLQYFLQALWFFLSKQIVGIVNSQMRLNNLAIEENFKHNIDLIQMYLSNFKMSIELDMYLYEKFQEQWNLENSFEDIVQKIVKRQEKLQNSEMEKLVKEVYTDTLTKTYTRKWIAENLLDKNGEFSEEGIMCVVDLNKFKKINDTHGHIVGDDVLVYIANQLRTLGEDVVRFGGDEFIVISRNIATRNFTRRMSELQYKVCNKDFRISENDSIKIGFAFGIENFYTGDKFDEVLDRADKKMYKDKEEGCIKKEDIEEKLSYVAKSTVDNIKSTIIAKSQIHGFGLWSVESILPDTVISEALDGQVVEYEFYKKFYMEQNDLFLEWNCISKDKLLIRPFRTKYSFINHSKNPNCEVREIDGALRVISIKEIKQGEELTLNYLNEPIPEEELKRYKNKYLRL